VPAIFVLLCSAAVAAHIIYPHALHTCAHLNSVIFDCQQEYGKVLAQSSNVPFWDMRVREHGEADKRQGVVEVPADGAVGGRQAEPEGCRAAAGGDGAPGQAAQAPLRQRWRSRAGQPSNRRTRDEVAARAMALVGAHYVDFGPTLAAEKLRELHGLPLSVETVRQRMRDPPGATGRRQAGCGALTANGGRTTIWCSATRSAAPVTAGRWRRPAVFKIARHRRRPRRTGVRIDASVCVHARHGSVMPARPGPCGPPGSATSTRGRSGAFAPAPIFAPSTC
jgi:hypothetical protein